jgi:hypothetical protein
MNNRYTEVISSFQVDEHGKFKIPARFLDEVKLYFANTNVELICRKKRSRRSIQQNKFLHVLFTIFSQKIRETQGNAPTPSILKEICKLKFLLVDVTDEETGEVIGQRIKGTSELNKSEMADFITEIYQYAVTKYDVVLPPANTEFEIDLYFDRK